MESYPGVFFFKFEFRNPHTCNYDKDSEAVTLVSVLCMTGWCDACPLGWCV